MLQRFLTVIVAPVLNPLEHLAQQLTDRHAHHQLAQQRHHKAGHVQYGQADIHVVLQALLAGLFVDLRLGHRQDLRVQLQLSHIGTEKKRRQVTDDRQRFYGVKGAGAVEPLEKIEALRLVEVAVKKKAVAFHLKLEGQVELEILQRRIPVPRPDRLVGHVHQKRPAGKSVVGVMGKYQHAPDANLIDTHPMPGQWFAIEQHRCDLARGKIRADQLLQQPVSGLVEIAPGVGNVQINLHVHAPRLTNRGECRVVTARGVDRPFFGGGQIEDLANMRLVGGPQVQLTAILHKLRSGQRRRCQPFRADTYHGGLRQATGCGTGRRKVLHGGLQQAVLLQVHGFYQQAAQIRADPTQVACGYLQCVVVDIQGVQRLGGQKGCELLGAKRIQGLDAVE